MIKQILLVAIGGGIGSTLRHFTSLWAAKNFPHIFPAGTFIVNILGCFIIGLLIGLSGRYMVFSNELKLVLLVGFCGGYTTFSAFSAESVKLFETGNYWALFLYVTASVTIGFLVLLGGNALSKII